MTFIPANELDTTLDAVLVLAHDVKPDGSPSDATRERLDAAALLLEQGKVDKIVLSGGLGHPELGYTRELSYFMQDYLLSLGVSSSRLLLESSSLETASQAIFLAKNFVKVYGWKSIGILSSAWHLPRVEHIFSRVVPDHDFIYLSGGNSNLVSEEKEASSIQAFERTFEGIVSGDIDGFYERLYERHPFFNGTP